MPKRKKMGKKYKRRRTFLSILALLLVGAFGWFLGQRGSGLPEERAPEAAVVEPNALPDADTRVNADEADTQPEEPQREETPTTVQDIDLNSWKLAVSTDSPVETALIYETCRVDSRIAETVTDMVNAARLDGIVLIPYRGYTAPVQAGTPDETDHATGLAIDFTTEEGLTPDASFGDARAYSWLNDNAYKYGFVLRFGEDKEAYTGEGYQPWHFRYVGEENAIIMKAMNYTLEEYRAMLEEERSRPADEDEGGEDTSGEEPAS